MKERSDSLLAGSSGIGLATAKQFVKEGAFVFMTGRRQQELNTAVKEIRRNVIAVQSDVSKMNDLDRLVDQIKREKGKLDILFANAGIAKYAPLGEISEDFYDSIFNINVRGLLFTVQKALPLLPDGASIIFDRIGRWQQKGFLQTAFIPQQKPPCVLLRAPHGPQI